MNLFKRLPLLNIQRKPGRSVALAVLSAFLAASVFAGSVIVSSLQSGLSSLEDRLGADIMVVPYSATTKSDLSNILLQGNKGYFYMDDQVLDQLSSIDGVGQMSSQFFLASANAGCCSFSVQIIGFDAKTDFVVQPWIRKSYQKPLETKDIIVGNDLNAFVGDTIRFYNVDCRVVGKLDKTGTMMDTTVYTSIPTCKLLMKSAYENKLNDFGNVDPDTVVSDVLINVDGEHNVEEVVNDINLHVKNVEAIKTKDMISGIAGSLQGVSRLIGILMACVWFLAIVILMVAYRMVTNERIREFAVLRVLGVSSRKLFSLILKEGMIIGLIGALCGVTAGALIVFPFHQMIESQLGLPYFLPSTARIVGLVLMALVVTVFTGGMAAAVSANRISKMDTGLILREDQ